MTTLLEQAFAEASKLPPQDQERFAAWIIEELQAEHRWNQLFAHSADALTQLADEALAEHRAGRTQPLDPELSVNSRTTARFRAAYELLPEQTRRQAREAYRLFQQNPAHPSLRFRLVHPTRPIYSARINLNYRALGIRDGDTIVWFWIGPHDAYERLLAHL